MGNSRIITAPNRRKHKDGYIEIRCFGHPRARLGGFVYEHVLVMEKHIGRYLVAPEEVHHRNEVRDDNRIENLQLCKDKAEHKDIHRRMRVLEAGGNPDTDKVCSGCHIPKPLSEFRTSPSKKDGHESTCRICHREYMRQRGKKWQQTLKKLNSN